MTARWTLCRAAIATTIEALTPETLPSRRYHEARSDAVLEGASGLRAFWQDPPNGGELVQQGAETVRLRYEWNLNVLLSRGVADIPDFVDGTATEPLNILRALLTMTPTEGADAVQVPRFATTTPGGDADEVQVQFALVCEIDEDL